MSELVSAAMGAGLVIGIAVPLFTLLAKAILIARWRRDPDPRHHGALPSFILLVAPSLGAVVWFVSAALHLSEPGGSDGACALDHAGATACVDALLFASFLTALAVSALTRGWRRHASRASASGTPVVVGAAHFERLARICVGHPRLRRLRHRIFAARGEVHPLCTRGLAGPRIEIATHFMDRLDDRALVAALLHEAEHHAARDPLRYLIASASIALNPCGFLLRSDLRRWRSAREAVCDEWAVRRAADPLSLAEAIVVAARPRRALRPFAVALDGPRHGLLQLRVQRLLDYAHTPPAPPTRAPFWLGLAAAVGVLLLPHLLGAWPLDVAHTALERALAELGLI